MQWSENTDQTFFSCNTLHVLNDRILGKISLYFCWVVVNLLSKLYKVRCKRLIMTKYLQINIQFEYIL